MTGGTGLDLEILDEETKFETTKTQKPVLKMSIANLTSKKERNQSAPKTKDARHTHIFTQKDLYQFGFKGSFYRSGSVKIT